MGKTYSDIYAVSNTTSISNSDIMILQRASGNTVGFTANSLFNYVTDNSYSGTYLAYNDTGGSVTLNLTKQIHKIEPTSTGPMYYTLPNGYEGQIIYLVPAHSSSNPFTSEYTGINIINARWTKSLQIKEGSVSYWLPFTDAIYNQYSGSCIITLIFTDGCWNLPHSYGTS